MRVICFALALGACVDVPPYAAPIGITWTDSLNGGGTATSQPVTLHFPGNGPFPFPDSVQLNGMELIGHSQLTACNFEDQVGIAMYPAPRISNDTSAMPNGGNGLNVKLRGPAVVQIEIVWGASYGCDNGMHYPDGTSRFTLFPNGRIVRYDEVHASDTSAANATTCAINSCSSDDTWYVTSYWTFSRAKFDGVLSDATPLMSNATLTGGTNYDATAFACVQNGSQYSATLTWRDQSANRFLVPSTETIALVHNIFSGPNIQTLDPTQRNITSSLTFAGSGCADMGPPHPDTDLDATINIADDSVRAGTDGIFGGDGVYTAFGAAVPNTTFEITGPTLGPFAVSLRFADPVETMQLEKSIPTSRPWYVPQRYDDNTWIVYFLDPLAAGQKVTVHPQ